MRKHSDLHRMALDALNSEDFTGALSHFSDLCVLQPEDAMVRNGLGAAYLGLHEFAQAKTQFLRALEYASESRLAADIHGNLGLVAMAQGRFADAHAAYTESLSLFPDHPVMRQHLGVLFVLQRRFSEARVEYERAVALGDAQGDRDPGAWDVLGGLRMRFGDFQGAVQAYRVAARLSPDNVNPIANLAGLLWRTGHLRQAETLLVAALRDHPEGPLLHSVLGDMLMSVGRFQEAWREHEWRFHPRLRNLTVAGFDRHLPRWDGANLSGRTLLVYADQGVGDAIQDMRFVPKLANQIDARVVLNLPPTLMPLFRMTPGVDEWRSGPDVEAICAGCDVQIPLARLAAMRNLTLDDVGEHGLRFDVSGDRLADWRDWMTVRRAGSLAVGLVWLGNIAHGYDVFRSMMPSNLAPLESIPGVRFFSLQTPDERRPEADFSLPFPTVDAAPRLTTWADTAAALRALDLVITVDTGVAHLAGALGVSTWLLLAHVPDARWMLKGETTPWYPSLRLFRQPVVGDWASVVNEVRKALLALSLD